jgi:hypothetical protein
MKPRLVFRTHFQADEPAYMGLLVKCCTSAVQSTYRETVAQKLAREITKRRGKSFNEDAGDYAVDLAKSLGLITDNYTWTEKGHLVNLVAEIRPDWSSQLTLRLSEKLLYFRTFLEADGAAMVFLARRLVETDGLGRPDITWNSLATEMFVRVFSDYLKISNSTADRVSLRNEIERIKANPYRGNTGPHKIFIHLQTLYRLGLLERASLSGPRVYRLPSAGGGSPCGLEVFLQDVPDIVALEERIKNEKWIEIAARVFGVSYTPIASFHDLLPVVATVYRRIAETGVPICPLSTLVESVQIELLASRYQLLSRDVAVAAFAALQKGNPKDVRLHVDRRGRPAFLRLSDDLVRRLSENKVLT